MLSSDVTVSTPIEATQYNNLRADVIANASAIENAEGALSAHVATAASIHGLGAGVNVIGTKASSGLRIEYAVATATWTHAGGQFEIHHAGAIWANSFSNLLAVTDSVQVNCPSGAAYITEPRNISYSNTAATVTAQVYDAQGETVSMQAGLIAIGS